MIGTQLAAFLIPFDDAERELLLVAVEFARGTAMGDRLANLMLADLDLDRLNGLADRLVAAGDSRA